MGFCSLTFTFISPLSCFYTFLKLQSLTKEELRVYLQEYTFIKIFIKLCSIFIAELANESMQSGTSLVHLMVHMLLYLIISEHDLTIATHIISTSHTIKGCQHYNNICTGTNYCYCCCCYANNRRRYYSMGLVN